MSQDAISFDPLDNTQTATQLQAFRDMIPTHAARAELEAKGMNAFPPMTYIGGGLLRFAIDAMSSLPGWPQRPPATDAEREQYNTMIQQSVDYAIALSAVPLPGPIVGWTGEAPAADIVASEAAPVEVTTDTPAANDVVLDGQDQMAAEIAAQPVNAATLTPEQQEQHLASGGSLYHAGKAD